MALFTGVGLARSLWNIITICSGIIIFVCGGIIIIFYVGIHYAPELEQRVPHADENPLNERVQHVEWYSRGSDLRRIVRRLPFPLGACNANRGLRIIHNFFHNKPVVIGVFAGGAVLLLLLASFITCLVRRSSRRRRRARQQQLDREMDASFRETVQRTRAAEEWRSTDPRGASSGSAPRKDSVSSEASGSHGMYYAQPLPLPPQQQPAFYAYDRDPAPTPAPAYRERERETPAVMGLAVRGVVAAPQIVQPARARVQGQQRYGNNNNLQSAAPSVAVGDIYPGLQPQPQPLPALYLPHYAVSPLSAQPTPANLASPTEMPITPTPFPNPFDQQQPQQQQQQQGHLLRTPSTMSTRTAVSPISPLPNPYGGMED
ncbi:hypothetical protein DFH08DRAFT_799476 [Mycena albidolilacea]|uniref:Uncharacterized protein n=1 Tax=Mycena albidolilacea TaxID=1033008 RepID=A0AAD7F322_9AGAR|nr:hypothetical protein DFH08DRAFT_799476 [Mycena albidolilacea]